MYVITYTGLPIKIEIVYVITYTMGFERDFFRVCNYIHSRIEREFSRVCNYIHWPIERDFFRVCN